MKHPTTRNCIVKCMPEMLDFFRSGEAQKALDELFWHRGKAARAKIEEYARPMDIAGDIGMSRCGYLVQGDLQERAISLNLKMLRIGSEIATAQGGMPLPVIFSRILFRLYYEKK